MKIMPITNMDFKSGSIELKGLNKEDIIYYDLIKKTAEKEGVDFTIRKSEPSEHNIYLIFAKKEFQEPVHSIHGLGIAILDKNKSSRVYLSNALRSAFFRALNKLKSDIAKYEIEHPGILKEVEKNIKEQAISKKQNFWAKFKMLFI